MRYLAAIAGGVTALLGYHTAVVAQVRTAILAAPVPQDCGYAKQYARNRGPIAPVTNPFTKIEAPSDCNLLSIYQTGDSRILPALGNSGEKVEDHRWEGFWFGAGAMGVMVGMLVHDACSNSTADRPCFVRTVGGMIMGGVPGGVIGGLIGRTIPKGKDEGG